MRTRTLHREDSPHGPLLVEQTGTLRELHFGNGITQSQIDLETPDRLPLAANRAMLAHLLFGQRPRAVLLAGCGGGAIARWLHARAPQVRGCAVELSPTVARLAREYFDFPRPDRSNWRLLVQDVREHLLRSRRYYDFILVDLEENQATPAWLTESAFLQACRNRLSRSGGLTINLIVDDARRTGAALHRIREVFGPDILLLTEPEHDNLLVLAFRDGMPELPPRDALARLGMRWGIDFVSLAGRITRLSETTARPRPA